VALVGRRSSLADEALAAYVHQAEFDTVVGKIKFGKNGEWADDRMLAMQFQNVDGNDAQQFRELRAEVSLYPPELASGAAIYLCEQALKK
jgi:branched-chain amino acid transport system substrate-binding protein